MKGRIVNILAFVGYTVTVATTQHCHYGTEAAIDIMKMITNQSDCAPIKLYFEKQAAGQIQLTGGGLLTPVL